MNENKQMLLKITSTFNFQKNIYSFKALCRTIFDFKFMITTFMIKLTQYAETASIRKFLIPLENLIIKIHFRN